MAEKKQPTKAVGAVKKKPAPRKPKEPKPDEVEIIDLTNDIVEVMDSEGPRVLIDANGDEQVIPDISQDLPIDMDIKRRRMVALTLRLSGANYNAIAQSLKISGSSAKRLVKEAFEELDRDDMRMQRAIYHQRLETLLMRNWSAALAGEQSSTNNVLAIMDRIDRLFNLSGGEMMEEPDAADEGFIIAHNASSAEYLSILNNARKALKPGKDHQ